MPKNGTRSKHSRRSRITKNWLVGFAVAAASTQPALAFDLNTYFLESATPYSATQVIASDKDSFQTQLYREGKKMRMDIAQKGKQVSIVMRGDTDTNYMLMHEMSMYQEVKNKRIERYRSASQMTFSNQQKIGSEEVNGYSTDMYTADFVDGDGKTGSGKFWVTNDDIVVRAEMAVQGRRRAKNTTVNLTNLQVGDQPDDLFEVPANYNSLNMGALFSGNRNSSRNSQPVSDSDQEQATSQSGDSAEPADQPVNVGEQPNTGKNVRKALGRLFGKGNG